MNKESIFNVIKQKIEYVCSDLDVSGLSSNDSLKELGADSMDRAEIIQLSMHELQLKIPMIEFGRARNIGELTDIFLLHKITGQQ